MPCIKRNKVSRAAQTTSGTPPTSIDSSIDPRRTAASFGPLGFGRPCRHRASSWLRAFPLLKSIADRGWPDSQGTTHAGRTSSATGRWCSARACSRHRAGAGRREAATARQPAGCTIPSRGSAICSPFARRRPRRRRASISMAAWAAARLCCSISSSIPFTSRRNAACTSRNSWRKRMRRSSGPQGGSRPDRQRGGGDRRERGAHSASTSLR